MKKNSLVFAAIILSMDASLVFAQNMDFSDEAFFPSDDSTVTSFESDFGSINDFGDDSFFGSDDEDWFGSADDEFFADDGIDELVALDEKSSAMAMGNLFETGSVRVGGSFDLGLSTYTSLYRDDDSDFWERVKDSRISPTVGASLFIDARPTNVLRMYTKFGIRYPFSDSIGMSLSSGSGQLDEDTKKDLEDMFPGVDISSLLSSGGMPSFSITNWLYLKELFTDFSVADKVFFRFGMHTVSWGAGFFFSPVSDMINSSSIDPENTSAQVDGSLNLRAQIPFTDSQNCLWLYLVPPSTTTTMPSGDNVGLSTYLDGAMYPYLLKQTAIAGKMDVVVGNWELGFGGVFRLENSPKIMVTASGSIINGKIGVFGEGVLSYGTQKQWNESTEWKNKDFIFQGTVGAMHVWTDPQITVMGQYYFDGNLDDHKYLTYGSNLAATVNFANIADSDFSATIFGLFYLGKTNVQSLSEAAELMTSGKAFMPYAGIVSITGSWTPFKNISFSAGPYITWTDMTKAPNVAMKLGVTLGGGKF